MEAALKILSCQILCKNGTKQQNQLGKRGFKWVHQVCSYQRSGLTHQLCWLVDICNPTLDLDDLDGLVYVVRRAASEASFSRVGNTPDALCKIHYS